MSFLIQQTEMVKDRSRVIAKIKKKLFQLSDHIRYTEILKNRTYISNKRNYQEISKKQLRGQVLLLYENNGF